MVLKKRRCFFSARQIGEGSLAPVVHLPAAAAVGDEPEHVGPLPLRGVRRKGGAEYQHIGPVKAAPLPPAVFQVGLGVLLVYQLQGIYDDI